MLIQLCDLSCSTAKPSVDKLEARLNLERRPFQLFNVPFYLVDRLEQLLG